MVLRRMPETTLRGLIRPRRRLIHRLPWHTSQGLGTIGVVPKSRPRTGPWAWQRTWASCIVPRRRSARRISRGRTPRVGSRWGRTTIRAAVWHRGRSSITRPRWRIPPGGIPLVLIISVRHTRIHRARPAWIIVWPSLRSRRGHPVHIRGRARHRVRSPTGVWHRRQIAS